MTIARAAARTLDMPDRPGRDTGLVRPGELSRRPCYQGSYHIGPVDTAGPSPRVARVRRRIWRAPQSPAPRVELPQLLQRRNGAIAADMREPGVGRGARGRGGCPGEARGITVPGCRRPSAAVRRPHVIVIGPGPRV